MQDAPSAGAEFSASQAPQEGEGCSKTSFKSIKLTKSWRQRRKQYLSLGFCKDDQCQDTRWYTSKPQARKPWKAGEYPQAFFDETQAKGALGLRVDFRKWLQCFCASSTEMSCQRKGKIK
jgi:hypothetical protein